MSGIFDCSRSCIHPLLHASQTAFILCSGLGSSCAASFPILNCIGSLTLRRFRIQIGQTCSLEFALLSQNKHFLIAVSYTSWGSPSPPVKSTLNPSAQDSSIFRSSFHF